MESNWLVSVIIPVYNVRPFLEEALDSVLNQSYANLEILVIDDGSTDGSGETCDAYAKRDGRVRVIHQENRGLSAARNAGLDAMTGDVVAFLDSDDAFDPDFVEEMLSAMIRESADVVVCRFTMHQTAGRLSCKGNERPHPSIAPGRYDRTEAIRSQVKGAINISVWNKLFRRALWNGIRFPEGHVFEDIEVTLQILEQCDSVFMIDRPLYKYRQRSGSIMNNYTMPAVIDDWITARTHFISFVEARTPGLFSGDDLAAARTIMINGMTTHYIRYCREAKRDAYAEGLRQRIIAQARTVGVVRLGFSTRIGHCMLCACPRLLQLVYPVYRAIRMCIYRIIGR